ncbi:hypothetical protein B0H13DRAFT_2435218 [Mycena leptocephala]|nr:hypothetical protein B0H13DRAFT_2435218 [Mycena leptocephala]
MLAGLILRLYFGIAGCIVPIIYVEAFDPNIITFTLAGPYDADGKEMYLLDHTAMVDEVKLYRYSCGYSSVAEFHARPKRAFASGDKSRWQIHGPLPLVFPTLKMGDMVVKLVSEFKHYAIKASKARGTANAIFALKHRIGSLPVREGLLLYKARVDCYLTSGCELSLDTDTLVTEHVEVQHLFLRRLLGLNSHSMLAVLFTETGLMPVRIRRLLLALGRLEYMLSTDPRRIVHSALLDSVALFREGKSGWASDLAVMLKRLPTAIDVEPEDLLSVSRVDAIKKEVVRIVDADLQHDIDNLIKTHMLRNRLESGEQKSLTLVTRRLRHYLTMVAVPAHRKAMTGLLLGDHNLSVERLRYPARYREAIPRQHRLCRFCRGDIEDEVHALFDCTADPRLVELRSRFLETLRICDSTTWDSYKRISNYDFMLKLVPSRKAVQVFAKYIFLVLSHYAEFPRYFPVAFRIPG